MGRLTTACGEMEQISWDRLGIRDFGDRREMTDSRDGMDATDKTDGQENVVPKATKATKVTKATKATKAILARLDLHQHMNALTHRSTIGETTLRSRFLVLQAGRAQGALCMCRTPKAVLAPIL